MNETNIIDAHTLLSPKALKYNIPQSNNFINDIYNVFDDPEFHEYFSYGTCRQIINRVKSTPIDTSKYNGIMVSVHGSYVLLIDWNLTDKNTDKNMNEDIAKVLIIDAYNETIDSTLDYYTNFFVDGIYGIVRFIGKLFNDH